VPVAPVVIGRGAFGNAGDPLVGPHHHLFLQSPGHEVPPHGPERPVAARDLVDGAAICRREGGFADDVGLILDRREIVCAEGVPVESQSDGHAGSGRQRPA
jgi:hypothetical protein